MRSRSSRWRTRVDLAFELGDLAVEIVERDVQNRQPVVGLAVFGLHRVEPLLLGEVLGAMCRSGELGVDRASSSNESC